MIASQNTTVIARTARFLLLLNVTDSPVNVLWQLYKSFKFLIHFVELIILIRNPFCQSLRGLSVSQNKNKNIEATISIRIKIPHHASKRRKIKTYYTLPPLLCSLSFLSASLSSLSVPLSLAMDEAIINMFSLIAKKRWATNTITKRFSYYSRDSATTRSRTCLSTYMSRSIKIIYIAQFSVSQFLRDHWFYICMFVDDNLYSANQDAVIVV